MSLPGLECTRAVCLRLGALEDDRRMGGAGPEVEVILSAGVPLRRTAEHAPGAKGATLSGNGQGLGEVAINAGVLHDALPRRAPVRKGLSSHFHGPREVRVVSYLTDDEVVGDGQRIAVLPVLDRLRAGDT